MSLPFAVACTHINFHTIAVACTDCKYTKKGRDFSRPTLYSIQTFYLAALGWMRLPAAIAGACCVGMGRGVLFPSPKPWFIGGI